MLHHQTPLVPSTALSAVLGRPVWLKMESAQPCASFKLRGIGAACEQAVARGATRLVSSSGGNAGYAVAWAARRLGVPALVVVPSRASERMRGLIAAEGAEVVVHGEIWDDAHAHCLTLEGAMIHPFDDPAVWEGHATLVHETARAMERPGTVVLSVGGGGLLCGVVAGLHDVGWADVPVLAVETRGAASYAAALAAGEPVTIRSIDSVALTLGAKRVCARSVAWAEVHPIRAWQCDDRAAIRACDRFLDDHRTLVEPACGAALAAVYDRAPELLDETGPVLVVVCGGAAVTRAQLEGWVSAG